MSTHGVEHKHKENSKAHPKVGLVLKDVSQEERDKATSSEDKKRKDSEYFHHQRKKAEKIEYLKKLFALTFNDAHWECTNHGKHFQYKNKQHPEQIVYIDKKKGEIKFSGQPIEKVIEAAERYEKECGYKVEYEVECDTLEGSISFMTELHQKGFDISKIQRLDTKDGKKYEMANLIADIKSKHPKPAQVPKLGTTQVQRE